MTIGEKIKKFRTAHNLSQNQLAIMSGMSEPAIRNYELGNRTPNAKQINKISGALGISPFALANPDIESYLGVMHTLFALEDMYGLHADEIDGTLCLRLDKRDRSFHEFFDRFTEWKNELDKLRNKEITRDEYDAWRYSYPRIEAERTKARLAAARKKKKEANVE